MRPFHLSDHPDRIREVCFRVNGEMMTCQGRFVAEIKDAKKIGMTIEIGRDMFSITGLTHPFHSLFKRFNPKDYARMSFLQYNVMMMLMLLMISLPIKMAARLLFTIKYVWVTPWFNI